MKTLDVQAFQNGLDKTLTELKNQESDIAKVKKKASKASHPLTTP